MPTRLINRQLWLTNQFGYGFNRSEYLEVGAALRSLAEDVRRMDPKGFVRAPLGPELTMPKSLIETRTYKYVADSGVSAALNRVVDFLRINVAQPTQLSESVLNQRFSS